MRALHRRLYSTQHQRAAQRVQCMCAPHAMSTAQHTVALHEPPQEGAGRCHTHYTASAPQLRSLSSASLLHGAHRGTPVPPPATATLWTQVARLIKLQCTCHCHAMPPQHTPLPPTSVLAIRGPPSHHADLLLAPALLRLDRRSQRPSTLRLLTPQKPRSQHHTRHTITSHRHTHQGGIREAAGSRFRAPLGHRRHTHTHRHHTHIPGLTQHTRRLARACRGDALSHSHTES